MKDRVLVTGATGFLGGALVDSLIETNRYEVRALVRRIDTADLQIDGVELVQGDVLDLASLVKAMEDCVGVFHVAAYVKSWAPDASRFFQVNVHGLENVIKATKLVGSITKLVYTSSFFALGPTKNGEVADESQIHSARNFCTVYEKSKYEADVLARRSAEEGVPIILLYPGVIYGPGKLTPGNIIGDILIERFNGRLPGYTGYGNDRFSFSYIVDVAVGHIAAFEKGTPGQRYILGGPNASLVDVFDISAAATRTSKPWFTIPLWVVQLYGFLSVIISRITGKDPVITHPAARVIKHQWAYSSSKAEKELGYECRSLQKGVVETLNYLKEKQLIKF